MRIALTLSVLALAPLLAAQPASAAEPTRLTYRTYAVGLRTAEVEANLAMDAAAYRVTLGFHTVGLASAIFSGHSHSAVSGRWAGARAVPDDYISRGVWRGEPRAVVIAFERGLALLRTLEPPREPEREEVGASFRAGAIDSLSAMATLIHTVAETGRCDVSATTFDGRRAAALVAQTVGLELLPETGRSNFSGTALRCDFTSRIVAGFRTDDDSRTDFRPLRGSAWLADTGSARPPLPVRIMLETRWFGHATTYLTAIDDSTDAIIASRAPAGQ